MLLCALSAMSTNVSLLFTGKLHGRGCRGSLVRSLRVYTTSSGRRFHTNSDRAAIQTFSPLLTCGRFVCTQPDRALSLGLGRWPAQGMQSAALLCDTTDTASPRSMCCQAFSMFLALSKCCRPAPTWRAEVVRSK
jgi:hypothetical protein